MWKEDRDERFEAMMTCALVMVIVGAALDEREQKFCYKMRDEDATEKVFIFFKTF